MKMETVTFKASNGNELTFGGDNTPFGLVYVTGLGEVEAEITMQQSAYIDGSQYRGVRMQERYLEVELILEGDAYADISQRRRDLAQLVNPRLGLGTFTYTNAGLGSRSIKAIAQSLPLFPDGASNRGERWQRATIRFVAPNPYFESEEKIAGAARYNSGLEFPFEFDSTTGMTFGTNVVTTNDEVDYQGDVPTGIIIELTATGSVTDPLIQNTTTGKGLRLKTIMSAGEVITIDTRVGSKSVRSSVNGNIFSRLDASMRDWLTLEVGSNMLAFSATTGMTNLFVNVYYTEKYLAV